MTRYRKSLVGIKLSPKECFDFILECFEEVKRLAQEHDVTEINNIDYASLRNIIQPYVALPFDEGNITIYVQKANMFFTNDEAIVCLHYANWKDSKNRIVEIEVDDIKRTGED